jgi:hypothetical protein
MEMIIFKLRPFYPTRIEQKAGIEKKKPLHLPELKKLKGNHNFHPNLNYKVLRHPVFLTYIHTDKEIR